MQKMNILLTGASGYVGQAFIKEFGHKYSIRAIGRTPIKGSIEFTKGDIRIYEDVLKAAIGIDVIVHLAAFAPEIKEEARNEDLFDSNVKGTFNILQAAVDQKVNRVVFASSICAVGYEGLELPVKENAKPNSSDGMYGLSKYIGEQLCESYTKWYGISMLCLRMATIVPQHKIIFPSDPNTPNWYGYVDIRDVVYAFDLAINVEGIKHGVFHICAENMFMKYDITEAKKKLGFRPAHNHVKFLPKKSLKAVKYENKIEARAIDGKKKINIAIEGRLLHRNITGSERYISELIKNIPDIENGDGYNYLLVNNSGYNSLNTPTIPYISLDQKINLYHRTYQFANYDELLEFLLAEKSVFTFLDLILCKHPDYFSNREAYEKNYTLMGLALNLSCRIIAISEHAKQDVIEMFDIPAEKVDVVYLGYDFKKFKKINDANEISKFKKKYNLPGKYILCISTDYPHKNLKNLLIAFAKIADRKIMKGYKLVLAGNSYYVEGEHYLKKYFTPIKDRIILLGHFDDKEIALLYNAADIFVFPSLYEGFGLPVLEAFACEVPLICSNATSLPEVAGDAAYMVDATEPDQIATAIVDIVSDSKLRKSLIEKGRKRAQQFTWEKCAKNTLEVYKKTLSEKQDFDSRYALNMKMLLDEFVKNKTVNLKKISIGTIKPKWGNILTLLKLFSNSIRREGFLKSTSKAIKYFLQRTW